MLDSFRKKEGPRVAPSPFNVLQEALSPEQKRESELAKREPEFPVVSAAVPAVEVPVLPEADAGRVVSTESSVSRLIVGPDIKLKGAEITDCDTLVVEGRVEASMDSRVIQIAEHGTFVGKVGIDIAEIRGRFEGELTARKHLVIRSTGHVSGTIRYGTVAIEEGGVLSGDIASLNGGSAGTAERERRSGGSSSRLLREANGA